MGGGRRVIAIDRNMVREARTIGAVAPLVVAFDHASGIGLGLVAVAVAAKSNEIPAMQEMLACLGLTGVVVAIDEIHAQTEIAIAGAGGDYVFTVKGLLGLECGVSTARRAGAVAGG